MAFKEVGPGQLTYVKYKECKPGKVLATGIYCGTRNGTYGIQHLIREESGTIVLNSSGQLNMLLENEVVKGDCIRVTYVGMSIIAKGKFQGKEAHNFKVEVDKENSVDADSVSVPTSLNSSENEYEDDTPAQKLNVVDDEDGLESELPTRTTEKVGKSVENAQDFLNRYQRKKA